MAGQVMLSISKDEVERARLTSEYKFAVDLQSKLVDERRKGRAEEKIEIAQKMLRRNRPIDEVVEDTGLTLEQIKELRVTN